MRNKIPHVLDPNKTLKHGMKDAKANLDYDWDGDVDILDKKKMVPGDFSSDPKDYTKIMKKKQELEKKHTKGGVAYESYIAIVKSAVKSIKKRKG